MASTPIAERGKVRRTTPSTSKDAAFLLAIIENRAREVGIACINMKSFEISLIQYVDNTNYMHTLSVIYAWDPIEIIMCKTAEESPLKSRISSHLSGFGITYVLRKAFDEVKGEEICMNSVSKIHDQDFDKKYVCMAALAGLIFHIESTQNVLIYKEKLKISLIYLKNFVIIDYASAKMLELVVSSQGQRKDSVAGVFECKTPAGNRMLRTCLLQPSREVSVINGRLEAVQELIGCNGARLELRSSLCSFANTEIITSKLVQKPKVTNEKYMKSQISNAINLFHNLDLAQGLLNTLVKSDFQSELLKNLTSLLDDRRIDGLYEEIREIVPETILQATSKSITISDCLFLVKSDINPLLDIARQVYTNTLEEINQLANQYKYKLTDPTLAIVQTASRGFHLQLDPSAIRNNSTQLGDHLIQISHKGKKCFASTPFLLSLNEKIKILQTEILTLTFALLEKVCEKARERILCLYNISYVLASLDLVLAFANFSIANESTRPVFKPGVLSLQEAKNPLLLSEKGLICSHIRFSEACAVQVLTGPNSSGKTTYLKNIALQCILAHTGCFLPAKDPIIPTIDYILTRIGEKESIEQNSSSFMAEMRDCSYILNTASRHSLVLIDELGKSTTHEDGLAIAWAISEKLINIRCFALIATHYHQLACLERFFPRVINMHMDQFVAAIGPAVEEFGYGVALASKSALPQNLVNFAKNLVGEVSGKFGYLVNKNQICVEFQRNALKIIEEIVRGKDSKCEGELREMIGRLRELQGNNSL